MVAILKHVKKELIKETEWRKPKSRVAAKRKLHQIVSYIGYPREVLSLDWLNYKYRNFNSFQEGLAKNRVSSRWVYLQNTSICK